MVLHQGDFPWKVLVYVDLCIEFCVLVQLSVLRDNSGAPVTWKNPNPLKLVCVLVV